MRAAPTRRRRRQPPPPAAAASQSARLAPLWPASVRAARLGRSSCERAPCSDRARARQYFPSSASLHRWWARPASARAVLRAEHTRPDSAGAREGVEGQAGVRRRTPWARARADVEPERPDARPPPDGGEDDVRPAAEGHGPCPTARPTAPNAAKRGRVFSHRGRCLRGVVLGAVPVPACSSAQFAS